MHRQSKKIYRTDLLKTKFWYYWSCDNHGFTVASFFMCAPPDVPTYSKYDAQFKNNNNNNS